MKKLLLLLAVLIAVSAGAQTRTVKGTVVSAEDGEPLIGVSVLPIGDKGNGTSTDLDGKFSLNVPSTVKQLRFSYVGYHPMTMDITADMKVAMKSTDTSLDEVMVVAYGTAKKSAYTGSASVVKADQIENTLVTDVTSALSGTVAGVQVRHADGAPGMEPTVRVRGTGSMSASSNPLYVVDGVPFDGAITTINPGDVESMTVLKDAAAAALYGARGANGVILITTKKGSAGKSKITFDANWGANSRQAQPYETIGGADAYYTQMYWALRNYADGTLHFDRNAAHAYANEYLSASPVLNLFGYQVFSTPNGQTLFDINGGFNPNATLGYLYNSSAGSYWLTPDNWQKETLVNGFRQNYSLSISGGGEKYDYMITGNFLDDDGIVRKSNYSRLTTRFVGNFQVTNWLKVGANMTYSYEKFNYDASNAAEGSSGNAFYMADYIAPIYPMYARDASGRIMYNAKTGYPIYDFGSMGMGEPNLTRAFMSGGNPTGSLVYDANNYQDDTFDGKWYAQINPLEGLTVTGSFGYWYYATRNFLLRNKTYGQLANMGGYVSQDANRYTSYNIQLLANYKKSWGLNNFDFLLGYESYTAKYDESAMSGYNTFDDTNLSVGNVIDNKDFSGGISRYATRGFFGRINYDWNARYYASFSYRRDASSRFAPKKRWGNFFSISVGWDIAKEKFMEDVSQIDMLKFKASFGQQGNDNIGSYYAYLDQYALVGSNGVWNASQMFYKGNPDLTWEKSNAFNIGFDFSFFQGVLTGTLEYFQRITSDMLYNRPVQPSLGYGAIPENVGSMTNQGVELELIATPIRTKDITWNVNFNITYLNNKILKLAPELNGEWISGSNIYCEGETIYQLYLVKYAGVDSETGLPMYWARTKEGVEVPTTDWNLAYSGSEEQGYVGNRAKTGNMFSPFYGGFGTTLMAYGFDVSIQFAYQLGGRIMDSGYQTLMHNGTSAGMAMHIDALKAWTPENANSTVPVLYRSWDYMNSSSDRWLTNASYLSLNNINIGYTFPDKWMGKIGIKSLRVYFAADNVALWSGRKGLDPRQARLSSYVGVYPAMRTLSGGFKFEF